MEISLEKYEEMQDRIANLETAIEIKSKQLNYALDLAIIGCRFQKRRRWKMFKANWIPIEAMLPEEKKYVMVTCLDYHGDTYVWLAKRVESFDDERGWCWLFADGNTDTDYGTPVYAWMPLPKPFDGRDA